MAEENVRKRVYVQSEVNGLKSIRPRRTSKNRSPCPVRLRGNRKLHEPDLRQMAETAIQTPPLRMTSTQCRWNDEQNWFPKVLYRSASANGHQTHQHAFLPDGSRRSQGDPG